MLSFNKILGSCGNFIFITRTTFHIIPALGNRRDEGSRNISQNTTFVPAWNFKENSEKTCQTFVPAWKFNKHFFLKYAQLLCLMFKSSGCRIFVFECLPNFRRQTYQSRLTYNCGGILTPIWNSFSKFQFFIFFCIVLNLSTF